MIVEEHDIDNLKKTNKQKNVNDKQTDRWVGNYMSQKWKIVNTVNPLTTKILQN